ncbi:MAG: tRNA (adenosine(37)-N6)-dimethylallyltransferase MiaA [Ignavibacteriales bacterium]
MSYDLITVVGVTATGKTKLAVRLASDFNGEIISADSRQVYKGMDIGTGKDLFEFKKYNVNYHLIDICEPSEEYNLFRFTDDFYISFNEIKRRNKLAFLAGGTGLYISSILQSYNLPKIIEQENELNKLSSISTANLKEILIGLKQNLHNTTDLNDRDRIIKAILVESSVRKNISGSMKLKSLTIGINLDREEIKQRITSRLKKRFTEGMIEEVQSLKKNGISSSKLESFGLEYKIICQHIDGKLNYNDMFQKLNSSIHAFAKRQMTWFRKLEREGVEISWFSPDDYSSIRNFVSEKLNEQ